MSTAHQETHAAAAHDASDHHGFDGEPARALPADEPPTPNWVPALGLAIFVVAGVMFLAMGSGDDDAGSGQAAPAEARPAAAADARPAAQGDQPPPGRRLALPTARPAAPTGPAAGAAAETLRAAEALGAPAAPGSANLRKLTPEEVQRVRKQMQEARQKSGAQQPPAAPK
ncbi:hypothetical protein [Sorangium sp. So ce406]|uniref:hypothetical protein n=1 Tax=Sorangium sp. So ce406 TaxID=3133311 RepID=UPI003F5B876D